MKPNPDELVKRIIGVLEIIEKKIRDENITDREGWTSAILTGVGELGQSSGFYAYAAPNAFANADGGEWRFDMAWTENKRPARDKDGESDEESLMQEFVLAGECEWGGEVDVVDDFGKLLPAHASIRLMVYDANEAGDMTDELLGRAKADSMRRPGDIFLLIARNKDIHTEEWWLEYVEIVVDNDLRADIVNPGMLPTVICSSPNPPR